MEGVCPARRAGSGSTGEIHRHESEAPSAGEVVPAARRHDRLRGGNAESARAMGHELGTRVAVSSRARTAATVAPLPRAPATCALPLGAPAIGAVPQSIRGALEPERREHA